MKYFNNLKKNQIVIYVVALMLVVAGYLNYTGNTDLKSAIQTSGTEEEITEILEMPNWLVVMLLTKIMLVKNVLSKTNWWKMKMLLKQIVILIIFLLRSLKEIQCTHK